MIKKKSSIVPIPKNGKKSLNKSDNYRSIAIGSIFSKVLDNIIIEKHSSVLHSSSLQFGFKAKHSTTQCCFVVQEVVDYFVRHDSICHVLLLDATKAFDRVNYVKLFQLLSKRCMCPLTTYLLLQMYTNQSLQVTWSTSCSESFQCSNGVKQGGVLSPILFCVYIDELLCQLKNAGYGCHIGDVYLGCFGYADDLTLLAPSISSAKFMLSICERFALEYDVCFNPSKSAHLLLYKPSTQHVNHNCPLYLNNVAIEKVENASLLGSCIGTNQNTINITKAISDLVYRTNILMSRFRSCNSSVLSKLFRSYCTAFYGSSLWGLSDAALQRVTVAWRKCLRRVWRISPRTHSALVSLIDGSPPLHHLLCSRFASFMANCQKSQNHVVKFIYRVCFHSDSVVASNIRHLCATLSLNNVDELVTCDYNKFFQTHANNDDDICTAMAVRDLISVRDGESQIFADHNDFYVNDFIFLLCVI